MSQNAMIDRPGKRSHSSVDDSQSDEDGSETASRQHTTSNVDENDEYAAAGLKNTLHGTIYQLKLLMLFVKRGISLKYDFRLATEMSAADKFDDVVFRYKTGDISKKKENKRKLVEGKRVCRYIQAKHRLDDESTKISTGDLLNEKDGDFSLQKYFISYRKIKNYSEQNGSSLEDCVICTNIGFDFGNARLQHSDFRFKIGDEGRKLCREELGLSEIGLVKVKKLDVFLGTESPSKKTARYRLLTNPKSNLHEVLRKVSDAHVLAKTLAEYVFNGKKLELRSIFKYYHAALSIHVLNVEKRCFHDKFINDANLSKESKIFRTNFCEEFLKLTDYTSEEMMWDSIGEYKMNFSETFGKEFVQKRSTLMTDLDEFCAAFVSLIVNANSDNLIVIDRKSVDVDIHKCFAVNMDKLAGNVLIEQDHEIKFDPRFLDDSSPLEGSLEEFKKLLKNQLREKFEDLYKYKFEVKNSPYWNQLYSSNKLPEDYIKDKEIKEFFDKLVFAVNQPKEDELDEIIRTQIGEDSKFNQLEAELVSRSFQKEMLDWFKKKGEKKGKEGKFYTAKDGEAFFKSMEDQLNTIVCSGLRSSYVEEFVDSIEFQSDNQKLYEWFTPSEKQPPLNLVAGGETLLSAIRVHQTISKRLKFKEYYDNLIFTCLGKLKQPRIKPRVIRAFNTPNQPNLLVIDCESAKIEDVQELYDELYETIEKHDAKKLILITESDMKFKNCSVKPDGVCNFDDLTEESQNKLLQGFVNVFPYLREPELNNIIGNRTQY